MASILGGSKNKISAKSSGGFKKGGKFSNPILGLVILLGVIIVGLTYSFFSSISATETYYVLGTDVPAHSQITADELQAVKTRKGTAPRAISLADVQSGQVYSQYDLLAGDVLTNSNTGHRASFYNGVSDQWVVTSFTIGASDAVDGNIMRGDYFDILGLGPRASKDGNKDDANAQASVKMGQGGTYIYYNLMCLFTTSHKTSRTNIKTAANSGDSSIEYFVAMPPKDVAMLHSALQSLQVKLVMSPRENMYKEPNAAAYGFSTFTYNGNTMQPRNASLCDDSKPGASSDCTDNTFLDVRRNKFGVPYNASANKIDENGNIIFKKGAPRLTEAETVWCNNLFREPYYLGSRWDADKQYCQDQVKGSSKEKELTERWARDMDKARDKVAVKSSDDAVGAHDNNSDNPSGSDDNKSGNPPSSDNSGESGKPAENK